MLLIIDNYDSFTYNLYQAFAGMHPEVKVIRNDQITLEEIKGLNPEAIILSPGPGGPKDAGICLEVVRCFASSIPILGVCLGHQVIGEVFGGRVNSSGEKVHGSSSLIYHEEKGLFNGLNSPMVAGRYHSLIVDQELPEVLQLTAKTADGLVMGVKHKDYPCFGIQFHPESILTPDGQKVMENFLNEIKRC
jgi:anthranilate synthase/aminodeoxychorismate synthase-like glutamine amidotransferase